VQRAECISPVPTIVAVRMKSQLTLRGRRSLAGLVCSASLNVAVSGVLAGCAVHAPSSTAESPRSGAVKPPVVDSSSTTSSLSASPYQPGDLRYDLQIFSIVQVLGGDSTRRADSSRITGILAASFSPASRKNAVTARVQPDSLSLTVSGGTSMPLSMVGPFIFTIDTQTGQVVPNADRIAQDCSQVSGDNLPLDGREVVPGIHLPRIDTWNDTLQTVTCRAGALLTVKRIASYIRIQAADSIVQLLRSTQFQITGRGYQWGQKIEVSGEGTSIDTLGMGGFPLRLQEVHGSSRASFVFRAPLRTQEFSQTAITRLKLRDH